ncbi:MAG TPA: YidC/Oxa1 family membrane protein insertase [Chloroflexota bacterium]|nr:YidC/Oxa1 family membrane protein insertase [Chloroflexota bacterium]
MSRWFRFISEPMAHALIFLAQNVGGAGIAIIVFTLGIKLLLVPLTIQQLKSARAMQELQPHIKDLQGKHKNDKQKLTEETMALYKEHHVNPAAGCLPLLVQLPILYGLYGALIALGNACATQVNGGCVPDPLHNDLFTQSFLWLHGQVTNGNGITLTGLSAPDPFHILPVFCVASQWVQQRMMQTNKTADPQQAAMQSMMQFMPLMIGVFSWNLAAGLPLYWAVSTLFSIVQQYFITGWGKLFQVPTFGGLGALLGGGGGGASSNGASRDGASRNGRQPRKSAAKPTKARTRRG